MERCTLQTTGSYLTAKCVKFWKKGRAHRRLIPCLECDCVRWYKGGGAEASQGLSNQTVSEQRAARWLHSAKPQTQTHPGPPHLPLGDTSWRKKTTIWPRTPSRRAAFIRSLSHCALEREGAISHQKDESPLSPFSRWYEEKYPRITQL